MTYLIAWLVFEFFYLIYYLGLFMVYFGTIKYYHINVPRVINVPIGILFLALIPLLSYRAKLAASAYSTNRFNLLEAHNISGATLKSYLSFLPIIGMLFRSNHDDTGKKGDYKH